MKAKDYAWAVSMETMFPPEQYQMTAAEMCLFMDAAKRDPVRTMFMAYNYGYQTGQNAEQNSGGETRNELYQGILENLEHMDERVLRLAYWATLELSRQAAAT